jgi:quinol monooxygenase YgiN
MPEGLSEAEWSSAIKELNTTIAKIGFPGAGYAFYKVANDSIKTNRYYFEGIWPAGDDYKKIHDHPEFKKASDKLAPLYDKVRAVEIYRKVVLVE